METMDRRPVPTWAYWICYCLIAVSFFPYARMLGRYPAPYVDEPFFNYPAMSYLDGNGFIYEVCDDAPYGDSIWSYHSPFFPRLQIPVFALLGSSQWTCRITEWLAAHLGVVILCRTLLKQGFLWAAITLAVAWLGDRSSQEVLLGRMEGLYFLCMATGFYALAGPRTVFFDLLAGASLASTFAFHPVTLLFPIAGGMLILWRSGTRHACWYALGVLVPATAFLVCWLPDIRASLQQFFWHAQLLQGGKSFWASVANLVNVLGWSRYWVIAVVCSIAALGTRNLIQAVCRKEGDGSSHRLQISSTAVVFGVCGLFGSLLLARSALFPYYVVAFTVWPIVAVATELELVSFRRSSAFVRIVAALLVLGWLPSLGWNMMRMREVVMFGSALDTGPFVAALQADIPHDSMVAGDPVLLGLAREAGILLRPFPYYGGGLDPAADAWLLITETEYLTPQRISANSLLGRPVIRKLNVYPEGSFLLLKVVLIGPRLQADKDSHAADKPQ